MQDVDGHALTLNLLGQYLSRAHGGDIHRRDRVKLEKADLETQGGHAFKTMAAYESWLKASGENGARQLAVLRLLGLFDSPADAGCLATLRRPPGIAGLTEPLFFKERGWWNWFKRPQPIEDTAWNLTVRALADSGLIFTSSTEASSLDAHPLIREYFACQLRKHNLDAWRAAHGRLFEYLQERAEHQPDTLEGLQPLYQAVGHGCQAERHEEACVKVYVVRILRGTGPDGHYSTRKLGAFGTNLRAVACFFETPWSRISPSLTEGTQAWLLSEAAFCLRALGRLTEALDPMRAGLQVYIEQENWEYAADLTNNLCSLDLMLTDVPSAMRDAKQSVVFADRSGEVFSRIRSRAVLADTLHQAGRRADALALFCEAEEMEAKYQPHSPLLYSLMGFQYCDLILAEAERAAWQAGSVAARAADGECRQDTGATSGLCREVEQRTAQTLRESEEYPGASILDIALDHLTLGRAGLYRAILERLDANMKAKSEIEQAVDGLRRAGVQDHLPGGLLTRAWLRSLTDNTDGARADLNEAWEIAVRGPMPLYMADIYLHRARLFHDRDGLAEARRLVEKHGYGRRLDELADAEAAAEHWQDAQQPEDGADGWRDA